MTACLPPKVGGRVLADKSLAPWPLELGPEFLHGEHHNALLRLVADGIELNRAYQYKFCSPTRCSLQSGRLPVHVNTENADPAAHNPEDPVSGFAGRCSTHCSVKQQATTDHDDVKRRLPAS